MISSYQQLEPKKKLAIVRAFFLLKQTPELAPFLDFLTTCDSQAARNLRTLPLEQIAKEQGKAQAIADLQELIDSATEAEIWSLREQANTL